MKLREKVNEFCEDNYYTLMVGLIAATAVVAATANVVMAVKNPSITKLFSSKK